MKSNVPRSDAKHFAECKKKTYYHCYWYGAWCAECNYGIKEKRLARNKRNSGQE